MSNSAGRWGAEYRAAPTEGEQQRSGRAPAPDVRRPTFVEIAAVLVAIGYTAAVIALVHRRLYFYGDDYSGFLLTRTETFWSSLLESVGGQVVPLARALNFAFFRIAGLRYGAAIGVLCAFHALGMVYLYRTLNLFRRSSLNAPLIAFYACYVHTWVPLGWWIAGLERTPFVAASAIALYYYVRCGQTKSRRDLAVACACNMIALGFYSKALLLPFCMVGLDLARTPVRKLREEARDVRLRWFAAAISFVFGVSWSLLAHKAAGALGGAFGRVTLGGLIEFYEVALTMFAHGFFGLSLSLMDYHPKAYVPLAWLLLVGYTCYRVPRAWVAWSVLLVLVVMNVGVIAVSSRIAVFGTIMALEIRYLWELGFFTVLFVGSILHRIPTTTPEAHWVRRAPRALIQVLASALLLGYAAVSYASSQARSLPDSHPMRKTKMFMSNLRAELATNAAIPLRLVDGDVPPFLIGFDLTFRRYSQLFALLDVPVAFEEASEADFRVANDGRLWPITSSIPDEDRQP